MQFILAYIFVLTVLTDLLDTSCQQLYPIVTCVHYTIISVVKLDLFIRVLLLHRILALGKNTYLVLLCE